MPKITVDRLVRLKVCSKSIEIFKRLWPKGAVWKTQSGLQRLVNRATKAGLDVDWVAKPLKLTATITIYWANGKKYFRNRRVNGILQGVCSAWRENGIRDYRGQYKDGLPYGKWFFYNQYDRGCLKYIEEYHQGKFVARRNRHGQYVIRSN